MGARPKKPEIISVRDEEYPERLAYVMNQLQHWVYCYDELGEPERGQRLQEARNIVGRLWLEITHPNVRLHSPAREAGR